MKYSAQHPENQFDFDHPAQALNSPSPITASERLARLQLCWADNVGPVTFRQLIARYGNAVAAVDALPELARRGGRKRPLIAPPRSAIEKEMEMLAAFGGEHLVLGDDHYPATLANIADAPPVLATKGHLGLLNKRSLAMVGARNASAIGRKLAQEFAHNIGMEGYVITSGLARGIDASAHMGAMDSGTTAVLGTGIDIPYPTENKEIYDRIARQGLLLSEHPLGTKPQARHFPRRNRIISGLSLGVLVVEAAIRSGSLITARFAGEQGREVFAIPGSPLDPRARGANRLIRDGAHLVEQPDDLLEHLDTLSRGALREPDDIFDPQGGHDATYGESERDHVIEQLSPTPTAIDDIIRFSKLTPGVVKGILLELEIAGRITRHFGNKVAFLPMDELD